MRVIVSVLLLILVPAVLACSDGEARERLAFVEQKVDEIAEMTAPSLSTADLRTAIDDGRGTSIAVHRLWVESNESGQFPRVVADIEIRNDADYPQANRFAVVVLTPRGEAFTLMSPSDSELLARAINNWSILPADSSQRGLISATDYRSSTWHDNPEPPGNVVEDLLAIDELLVFVDGSARVTRLGVVPERGRINEYVAPSGSTTVTPTFDTWHTYLLGTGLQQVPVMETFNPATTLARLAFVLSIDKTGYNSGHPQAVACARWLLTGSGSSSDCGYERAE